MASRRPRKTTRSRRPSDDKTSPIPAEVIAASPDLGVGVDARSISEMDDSQARVGRYWKWARQSLEAQSEFAAAYEENMRMLGNDKAGHWTADALAQMEKDGRPALIINHATAVCMTVWGIQRRNRQIGKFLPSDPSESGAVELLEHLYRWYYDQLGMKEIDSQVFFKKYTGGLCFWKLFYDTSEDPRGTPSCELTNALNILYDPNFPDVPWKDARYAIHAEWQDVDDAVDMWPKWEAKIRGVVGEWIKWDQNRGGNLGDTKAPDRFFWDPETQRIRIAQVWYKRVKKATVALYEDGTVDWEEEKVDAIREQLKLDPEAKNFVELVERPVTTIWRAHWLDQIELDHEESDLPFRQLPLVPSLGYYFWRRPVGAMDYMKDPQREKNKRRSVITDISGRAAHSGMIAEENSIDKKEWEEYVNGSQVLLEYKTGAQPPTPIKPPELPQYLVYLEQQSTDDIPRTVNVTPEMQGQPKANVISGRAINARQESGQLSQEFFFDTFATEQATVAKMLAEMIKDKTSREEARRILGALAQNDDNDDLKNAISNMSTDDFERLLDQAWKAKFSVVVTTEPWDPSGKMAGLRAMTDILPLVPQAALIAQDLVIQQAVEAGALPKKIGMAWLTRLQKAQQAPPTGSEGQPGAGAGTPQMSIQEMLAASGGAGQA